MWVEMTGCIALYVSWFDAVGASGARSTKSTG